MNKTSGVIKKYLKEKNISQVLLAQLLNVSPQYINAILNDKKSLSKKVFDKLVKLLKISENDKELIVKYEYFKKNIQINDSKNSIKQFGIYRKSGFEQILNDKEINLVNFNFDDSFFYIIIKTDILKDFSENQYLFFKKITEFKENKIHLIQIDNLIELAYLEYVDNKILIRFLNNNLKSMLINKSKVMKLKVIGVLFGKYIVE